MKNLYFISFITVDSDNSTNNHQVYRRAYTTRQAIANLKFSYRPRLIRDITISQIPSAKDEQYQLSFLSK